MDYTDGTDMRKPIDEELSLKRNSPRMARIVTPSDLRLPPSVFRALRSVAACLRQVALHVNPYHPCNPRTKNLPALRPPPSDLRLPPSVFRALRSVAACLRQVALRFHPCPPFHPWAKNLPDLRP